MPAAAHDGAGTSIALFILMAHQTNVHAVKQQISPEEPKAKATDPVCGMEIERRSSRHMVFRGEDTFYFCSRQCKETFVSPEFWRKRAA